jgi:hypothetical protein
MGNIADRVLTRGLVPILILSVGILALPEKLVGAGSGSRLAGQAQRIQDPEKMQKALYGLVQKARAQHAQLDNWHRQAQQGKAKSGIQNRRPVARVSELNYAWGKFCKARLAMTDTPVGVASPVSMRVLDSCSSGTNLPLNRK